MTQDDLINHSIEYHSIFGDYKQHENRVTCALLHILNYCGCELIDLLIDRFGGDVGNRDPLVATQLLLKDKGNVLKDEQGNDCCADGLIVNDYSYKIYIEAKIAPNQIRQKQLEAYRRNVRPDTNEYLLYITPDANKPKELETRDYWLNWDDIMGLLNEYALSKEDEIISFLVKNFRILTEKLIKNKPHIIKKVDDDIENHATKSVDKTLLCGENDDSVVLIVGGRWGENIAVLFNFYACQPNRFFLPAKYIAFYYNNRIKYLFKILEGPISSIELTDPSLQIDEGYFSDYDKDYRESEGKEREFFRLKLVHVFKGDGIINDSESKKNGNRCAFVRRQRYTSIGKILKAKRTSEL